MQEHLKGLCCNQHNGLAGELLCRQDFQPAKVFCLYDHFDRQIFCHFCLAGSWGLVSEDHLRKAAWTNFENFYSGTLGALHFRFQVELPSYADERSLLKVAGAVLESLRTHPV